MKKILPVIFLMACSFAFAQGKFKIVETGKHVDYPQCNTVAVSPDGSYLVSRGSDKFSTVSMIHIWTRTAAGYAWAKSMTIGPISNSIDDMTISPDGNLLAVTCELGDIFIYRRTANLIYKKIQRFTDFGEDAYNPSFSCNGKYFTCYSDGRAIFWEINGDNFTKVLDQNKYSRYVFSPHDPTLLYNEMRLLRFNGSSLEKIADLQVPHESNFDPESVSFSPDGTYFAAIEHGSSGDIALFKKQENGDYRFTYFADNVENGMSGAQFLSFTPDSRYFIFFNDDPPDGKKKFEIWGIDSDTLFKETEYGAYKNYFESFTFLNNGLTAIGTDWDGFHVYKITGVKGNSLYKEKPVYTSTNSSKPPVVVKKDTVIKTVPPVSITNVIWITPNPDVLNDKPVVSEKDMIEIQVKVITNKPVTKDDIKVIINGKEMQKNKFNEVSLKEGPKSDLSEFTYINTIPLEETADHINTIEVYANGKKCAKPIKVLYSASRPNLHILAISTAMDMQYSQKDAQDFASLFAGQNELYGSMDIKILTGKDATTNAVKECIERIRYDFKSGAIGPRDVMLIYINGHGFMYENQLRIQGSDYKDEFKETYSFSYNEIISRLNDISCKKLIFLDASHKAGAKASITEVNNAVNQLNQQPSGTMTLCSSSGGQFSYEDAVWENGAFMYCMKEGIKQGKADLDHNGIISISELYAYVKVNVAKEVMAKKGTLQEPEMVTNALLGSTSIYVIKP